jgi:hypothetical protein
MTIHELLQAAGLTANDEIPIWDADGTGEPTKKITAQQLAAAVVSLANLVTGVKGNTESSYRTGNVNITPANIGAVATNLTAIADCDDNTLTGNGGQIHFYRTNGNTLNTPYKQGLTDAVAGLLVVLGDANYTTQIHYQDADTKYYIRSKSGTGSTWNGKAWTINVLKPDMVGEEITLLSNPLAINNGILQYTANTGNTFEAYKFVDLYFVVQGGYTNAIRLCPEYGNKTYKFGFFAWHPDDNVLRKVAVTFNTSGRYFTNCVVRVAVGDNAAFNTADNVLYLYKAIGYKW